MGRNENFPQCQIISFFCANLVSRQRKQALCTFLCCFDQTFNAEERSDCQTNVRSQVLLNEPREIYVSPLTSEYGKNDVKFAFWRALFEQICEVMCAKRVLVFSVRDAKACGSESSLMREM